MTSNTNFTPTPSENALEFVAKQLSKSVDQFTIDRVTGGYSRNRRGLIHIGTQSFFVKEVDETLLPGDGQEERDWLAKDQGVMELLRSEAIELVPEESWLSTDSRVLMMTAYPASEGWLWDMPKDNALQQNYINAVVGACKELETATFTVEDEERLNLKPYFRDKLSDPVTYQAFFGLNDTIDNLVERFEQLASSSDNPEHRVLLHGLVVAFRHKSSLKELPNAMAKLRQQPNEVFSHCDTRTDNLTYNSELDKLILVDWNWASITPRGFGATEFLISVAARGADITPWLRDLNHDLLGTLVAFWSMCCMKPELIAGGNLRDHQAVSAAVTWDLFTKLG